MKNARFFGAILSIAFLFLGGEASRASTLFLDLDHIGVSSVGDMLFPLMLGVFATGVLTFPIKRIPRRWVFLALALISPLGFAVLDSNADLNGDAMVTSQDISKLAICFGQDPSSNSDCAKADVDVDGDIDGDDFSFVSERLGEAYPWKLYSGPVVFETGNQYLTTVALGDVNGDGVLDAVTGGYHGSSVMVLLGNGDGAFQERYRLRLTEEGIEQITLSDINGDGSLDVLTNTRTPGISVWLGNGDGSFQMEQRYATAADGYTHSFVVGEVNGDDLLDVVVLQESGSSSLPGNISVLLGNGDGGFQAQQQLFAVGVNPGSLALGDISGDGALDIVVTYYGNNRASMLLGNGDGTFQAPQRFDDVGSSVALGDVNGDSRLDVVGSAGVVLLGNGDGNFQEPQYFDSTGWNVVLDDVNGDDLLDVLVFGNNRISVLLGNGDGSFQTAQHTCAGRGILGDLNGDGALDVVVLKAGYYNDRWEEDVARSQLSVLFGNGDGTFQARRCFAVGDGPGSLALGDINGDDLIDVVYANWESENISVLLGNGDGNFQAQRRIAIGDYPGPLALGDVNEDGILDVVVANGDWQNGGGISILVGNGDGSFQAQQRFVVGGRHPSLVELGDINGDGWVDIVSNIENIDDNYHYYTNTYVSLNNGDGSFQTAQHLCAGGGMLSDLNGDGWVDIVSNISTWGGHDIGGEFYNYSYHVLLNNGDGSFQTVRQGTDPVVALVDVNRDGAVDIWIHDRQYWDNFPHVVLGNGDGSFRMNWGPHQIAIDGPMEFGDVNRDGAVDIVTRFKGNLSVFLGNGDGSFLGQQRYGRLYGQSFAVGEITGSIALGDINGDGLLDVVVANPSSLDYPDSGNISVLLGKGN